MGLRTFLGLKKTKQVSYVVDSYSQEGEDGILSRIFENISEGFFIDVGAHHPMRFSNTYKFYRIGWKGINIDAWPGSMDAFNKIRPRDINLEVPVSDIKQMLPFYIMNEPALNTLSLELANEYSKKEIYHIEKIVNIETRTLANILDEFLPENQEINFISIDAEGYDYRILTSNNWDLYRPKVLLIENSLSIPELLESELVDFMKKKKYVFFAKTINTVFFKDIDFNY